MSAELAKEELLFGVFHKPMAESDESRMKRLKGRLFGCITASDGRIFETVLDASAHRPSAGEEREDAVKFCLLNPNNFDVKDTDENEHVLCVEPYRLLGVYAIDTYDYRGLELDRLPQGPEVIRNAWSPKWHEGEYHEF